MKKVIKDTGENILFECEVDSFTKAVEMAVREKVPLKKADLRGAYLYGAIFPEADLREADLRGVTFHRSILNNANLSGASLRAADLTGANFRNANFYIANLSEADLRDADLRGADLSGACLYRANLSGADLRGACLCRADFYGAYIFETKFDAEIPDNIRVVPKEGEFVAWKKCRGDVIVKLLIPADAERSNAFSGKCRASKAVVLEVIGMDAGLSMHDHKTMYHVGETVYPDKWDPNWWNECSNGIHFFMKREAAKNY